MRLEIEDLGKAHIVRLHGNITTDNFGAIREDLIAQVGIRRYLILNFADVTAIDSAGMSTLVGLKHAVRDVVGHFKEYLKLSDLNPVVDKCFQIMCFDQLFPIYETENAAFESIPEETLLLADNSASRIEMLEAMLQFHGFDVISDLDGGSAEEMLANQEVQMVLCGRSSTSQDSAGQDLMAELTRLGDTYNVPVLGLSITEDLENAFSMDRVKDFTDSEHFQGFLQKIRQAITAPA